MRLFCKCLLFSLLWSVSLPSHAQDPGEEPTGPWAFPIARPDKTDVTSLKLIDLHLKARGGRIELEQVKSVSCKGTHWEGQKEYSVEVTFGTPGKIRVLSDYFSRGYNYITLSGTDGESAWVQPLEPDQRNPKPLTGLDRQLLELDACLPFLMLQADRLGVVFKYTGEDTFADQKVYVMHAWLKNGLEIEILLDAKSFMVINYRQPFAIGSQTLIVDRMPVGLSRVMDTWWEQGYNYALRGKGLQKTVYKKMSGSPEAREESFEEPPTRERWLRASP